jgi:hypothetical protein
VDRHGRRVTLDPAFTILTGITNARVAADGRGLGAVLADLAAFSGDAPLWSWGKDEINLMAISGYVEGIAPPIPAARFGNACALLIRAGVPYAEVQRLRSHSLCAHFGLTPPLMPCRWSC